jgi:hypothetical protein
VTVTQLQDKLIAAELAAISKHGRNTATTRKVIFAARTRFQHAVEALGIDRPMSKMLTLDAVDMVMLHLESEAHIELKETKS